MKSRIVIINLTILIIFLLIYIINIKVKAKSLIITNNQEYKIEELNDEYKILVYSPITPYSKLNSVINKKLNDYIIQFKKNIRSSPIKDNYYSLIIFYDKYIYSNYISYVFKIESHYFMAHPDHMIYTVVFDIDNKKIITLDDLIKYNNKVLDIFSFESKEKLKNNERIVDYDMLLDGTKPIYNNFNNFVFSKNGIIIFFKRYQVAPYSSGEFSVNIPYDLIM